MSNISYDFAVDNVIAVDAPIGTDPDTLIEQVKVKLIERIQEGDITFMFVLHILIQSFRIENVFDGETCDYSEDWEHYKKNSISLIRKGVIKGDIPTDDKEPS